MKKINFKQPKYIIPLMALAPILFITHTLSGFSDDNETAKGNQLAKSETISTNMGEVKNAEIKGKSDAYQEFFQQRSGSRTRISNFNDEADSIQYYNDDLTDEEKWIIDSLEQDRLAKIEMERLSNVSEQARQQQQYYAQKAQQEQAQQRESDKEYERSMKLLSMVNGSNEEVKQLNEKNQTQPQEEDVNWKDDQLSLMREQMMLMDSIEKANNPELRAQADANKRLKQKQEEMEMFLNSTLPVSKGAKNGNFNSIYKENGGSFIRAVIDEELKGYMGSRVRLRLLEDIYVGSLKLDKGTFLYALISGFSLQRVNLKIVSVMYQNEILPINLSIYDIDGMEGLYVPSSAFREMTRTMGQNVVQGSNMSMDNADFFQTALTSMYRSTSQTIAQLIRKNKVKLKYNSFIYLIDNKDLQDKRNEIYQSNISK